MKVDRINIDKSQVNFGYSNILKTLFREDEMPSVTKGIYGHPIDKHNVTLEHLKPHSKGGGTTLSNLALAEKSANHIRGNKPLKNFLTGEMLDGYLAQFNFRIPDKFDGFQYQEMIRKTCAEQGVKGAAKEVILSSGDSFVKQLGDATDCGSVKSAVKEIASSSGDSFIKQAEPIIIDYGSMKSILENFEFVDLSKLSKKMLKSLRHRGLI